MACVYFLALRSVLEGMQVDPEVSRKKFRREVERLVEQQATLESRGLFVLGRPEFPIVEIVVVPRHPLRVLVQPQQSGQIFLPQGTIVAIEVPSLSATAFKAHFELSDYDLRPPSLEFRDVWSDLPLPYHTMFRALEFEKHRQTHVVLLPDHPVTHKPFLCLRGIREYHEHPQHSGDDWMLYRGTMNLFSIVMAMWRATVDLVHPQLLPHAGGVQVNWAAEEKL